MNGIDRRALLRGLVSLPVITPALTLPAAASEASRPDLDGFGMIYLDGRAVYFDSNDYLLPAGSQALVIADGGRSIASRQISENPLHRPRYSQRRGNIDIGDPLGGGYACIADVPIIGRVLKG